MTRALHTAAALVHNGWIMQPNPRHRFPDRHPHLGLDRGHGDGYEYVVVTVPPGHSVDSARREVAERTEHGRWELHRTLIYRGGVRRYWMRRRFIAVAPTL